MGMKYPFGDLFRGVRAHRLDELSPGGFDRMNRKAIRDRIRTTHKRRNDGTLKNLADAGLQRGVNTRPVKLNNVTQGRWYNRARTHSRPGADRGH